LIPSFGERHESEEKDERKRGKKRRKQKKEEKKRRNRGGQEKRGKNNRARTETQKDGTPAWRSVSWPGGRTADDTPVLIRLLDDDSGVGLALCEFRQSLTLMQIGSS